MRSKPVRVRLGRLDRHAGEYISGAMPWLRIGRREEFEGPELTKRTILGRPIGIFRTTAGELAAMEVSCRHQNADLTLGTREGDVVTCPRHGWRYDLSTGACLTEAWARLRRYELEIRGEEVWLSTTPVE